MGLTVDAAGENVTFSFNGLGNVAGTCTGVGFGETVPITNHAFTYSANMGQLTANGTFGPSFVTGSAQVLTNPCTTGSSRGSSPAPTATSRRPRGNSSAPTSSTTRGEDQTQQLTAKRGQSTTFDVGVVNQGETTSDFLVKGCKSSKGFKVTWSDDSGNVTQQIGDGTYETAQLASTQVGNDPQELKLKIKALSSAKVGKTKTCKAVPSGDFLVDVVKAKLKVKAARPALPLAALAPVAIEAQPELLGRHRLAQAHGDVVAPRSRAARRASPRTRRRSPPELTSAASRR